jgi:hypothetical protein
MLFDAGRTNCSSETAQATAKGTCPVTVCTAQFGIRLPDGKLYKFDDADNQKAADALRHSKKAGKAVYDYWRTGKTSTAVTARVTGTLTSDTLNLDTIKVD